MKADFATRLAALGLSQVQLRRWIERLTGRRINKQTTSRYSMPADSPHHRETPPAVDALLTILEKHPAVLRESKEMGR